MTGTSPAYAISSAFADLGRDELPANAALPRYIEHYLPAHAGETDWALISGDTVLLDHLSVEAIQSEVARAGLFGPVPAPIRATVWDAPACSAAHPSERGFVRELAQTLLGDRSFNSPILWATPRAVFSVPLTGHTDGVSGCGGPPPGGTLLATASWDQTVRLWDPATGQPVGDPLTGHTDGVTRVAFGRLPGRRPCWPPPATTRRCGCGTRPPAPRSGTR